MLLALPDELVLHIFELSTERKAVEGRHRPDNCALLRLALTCRRLSALGRHILYRDVVLGTTYDRTKSSRTFIVQSTRDSLAAFFNSPVRWTAITRSAHVALGTERKYNLCRFTRVHHPSCLADISPLFSLPTLQTLSLDVHFDVEHHDGNWGDSLRSARIRELRYTHRTRDMGPALLRALVFACVESLERLVLELYLPSDSDGDATAAVVQEWLRLPEATHLRSIRISRGCTSLYNSPGRRDQPYLREETDQQLVQYPRPGTRVEAANFNVPFNFSSHC
ncbi:hypothetical protein EXIGLDRAFT_764241 [Exidia glandulosa HHB12029]|uniref:F-box domain-containing protein n=1 Tax=Exidia glandulosa HHB12029 TaxID=1314781 RepID=A0A165LA28_EXIGL|nr:hypothetical protein EXIGLDRAFT_764241 [Exidia glandulosa HHB12029]